MENTIWFEPLTIEHFKDSSVNMDKALGIQVTEIGDDYIVAKMPVTEKTKQPYGILHGGASCVLAESIGSIAAGLSMAIISSGLPIALLSTDARASLPAGAPVPRIL